MRGNHIEHLSKLLVQSSGLWQLLGRCTQMHHQDSVSRFGGVLFRVNDMYIDIYPRSRGVGIQPLQMM